MSTPAISYFENGNVKNFLSADMVKILKKFFFKFCRE